MVSVDREYVDRHARFRRRGARYALLSLLLTMMILVLSGCAVELMTGDNKEAYERLEKAVDYFKYPFSVNIVSGEMYEGKLYCCVKAKNGFGNYRYGTYSISSTGYPSESSSARCYSSDLDTDLINNALADHFGLEHPATTKTSNNLFINMMTGGLEKMWFVYILIIAAILAINGLLASKASDLAAEKGYEKKTWFHMCFWLGFIPYVIIAAMPDLVMRQKQDKTNKLLEKLISIQETSFEKKQQFVQSSAQADVTTFLPEL